MRLFTLILPRWLIAALILLVLGAVLIWTIRPSPFQEWLGGVGLGNLTPLPILRAWVDDQLAPLTPLGFFSLFPVAEFLIPLALLAALLVLVVLLFAPWWTRRHGSWLTRPISLLRLPRIGMRVRTALALIAIVGLDLGWETVAWRNWRLRDHYRNRLANYTSSEATWREELRRVERQLASLDAVDPERPGDTRTAAARAAQRAYQRDQLRLQAAELSQQVAAYSELRRKYERAVADPSAPVPPDPPRVVSDQPPPGPDLWIAQGEYARALAGCDELIRLYPDLVEAHERRAWILATCPDARYRDGPRAVVSATRAAELTTWKNGVVLETLAAACAEAGDFAAAVHWQQRARERITAEWQEVVRERFAPGGMGLDPKPEQDQRLALYKAGKPFRMRR